MTLGVICLFSSGYTAEQQKTINPEGNRVQLQNSNAELQAQINFSRQLMKSKNFEGASALLETLYEKNPSNDLIINLLWKCYEELSYFAKAEEIVRRQVERNPDNMNFQLTYAEILARQGKTEDALKAYNKTLSMIEDDNLIRVQMVLQSMMANSFDNESVALIDKWRGKTGDTVLFALQRGGILGKQKKYIEAAADFFSILADTSRIGNEAEKKIIELLDFVDSEKKVTEYLLKRNDLYDYPPALKILADHFLKIGQYDRAFEFTVTQDSVEGFKGQTLVVFMKSCVEKKLYPQGLKMGEYLFRHYQNYPLVTDAYFIYGEILTSTGQYDRAIKTYDTIFEITQHSRDKGEVLQKIGDLYLNHLHDYNRALVYYDSLIDNYPNGLSYLNALIARPNCYLCLGDLKKAKAEYEYLDKMRMQDDLKEEIAYNTGLIYFFEKKIDSAQAVFNKLMVDYPRGYYVNDVLKLLMIMGDASDSPTILYDYSNAMLFEKRNMTDTTIQKLSLIAENSEKILADLALYRLAEIYISVKNDSTTGMSYLDRLIDNFPDSYYLPFGLKEKADILYSSQISVEQAKNIYLQLLEKFTDYPFINDVRERLRNIEENPKAA